MQTLHVNDNVDLRILLERDAEELFTLMTSWPHVPQLDEMWFAPATVDGALTYIRHGMALHDKKTGTLFGISVDNRLAGILQLERKQYGQTVGIDYTLAPAYRGQGIVTQSCAAALRYIFEEWEMHRAEIWVDVVNRKSCAIPERLGFVMEGIHRHLACYGNDWYGDIAVYSLLKDEWLAWKNPLL